MEFLSSTRKKKRERKRRTPKMSQFGPFVSFLVARSRDKLHLCTYTDPGFQGNNTGNFKTQQQRILMRMQVPPGGGYLSFDHKDLVYFSFVDEATDLTFLVIASNLLWTSRSASQLEALACQVLSGIFSEFLSFASPEEIASASRPYHFIKFETMMLKSVKKTISEAKLSTKTTTGAHVGGGGAGAPGAGGQQYDLLRKEIAGVQTVIKQNLEDILTRGERLETMNSHASQLKAHSADYKNRTTKLNRMRFLKMYGPPAAIVLFVLIYLCWKWVL